MSDPGAPLPSKESIERQFIVSGEKDRLKEILLQKLDECGWNTQVQERCRQIIKERGIDNVSSDTLVTEVTPFARKQVPNEVKKELLDLIRQYIQSVSGLGDF